MASPGVMSRTSAVLASSHAVAAGSIASNSGLLPRIGKSICAAFRRGYRVLAVAGSVGAASGHSAGLDEVLIRARRSRAALSLVLRSRLGAAVGMLGGTGQPQQ